MRDGSGFSGPIDHNTLGPNHQPPPWIRTPEEFHTDDYRVYIRTADTLGYTSTLTEGRAPTNHSAPHVPFEINIQIRGALIRRALNFEFFHGNEQYNDGLRSRIYAALPGPVIFTTLLSNVPRYQ